jgi:hypothetical protein
MGQSLAINHDFSATRLFSWPAVAVRDDWVKSIAGVAWQSGAPAPRRCGPVLPDGDGFLTFLSSSRAVLLITYASLIAGQLAVDQ